MIVSQAPMKCHQVLLLIGVCIALLVFQAGVAFDSFHQFERDHLISTRIHTGSEEQQRQDHEESKPLFVLHIGPAKTGTTTIQEFAIQYRSLLEENNVYYLGNGHFEEGYCTHALVRACRNGREDDCKAAWTDFGQLLEYHHARNHTVFVSEENFSSFNKDLEDACLFKYLMPLLDKWKVEIVFTYRRHYETISSRYHQVNHPGNKTEYKTWPGMGGAVIPSFAQFVDKWEQQRPFYEPLAIRLRWQARFPARNVSIFNFHADGPLLQRFYCQQVRQAQRVCQLLMNRTQALQSNPSSSKYLRFDMIAVAAFKQGLVNQTLSRASVRNAIQKQASKLGLEKLTDFPLKHLSTRQGNDLLLHSIKVESLLVPDFHSKSLLEAGFQSYVSAGRLASVDTDIILKDPMWKQFFSELI